jgi:protein involved in polysaccharide export with SLBB domain
VHGQGTGAPPAAGGTPPAAQQAPAPNPPATTTPTQPTTPPATPSTTTATPPATEPGKEPSAEEPQTPPEDDVVPSFRRPVWTPIVAAKQFSSLRRFGASVFSSPVPLQPTSPGAEPGPTAGSPATGGAGQESGQPEEAAGAAIGPRAALPTVASGAPVPPNYVLGPGDVIELHVWSRGRAQLRTEATAGTERTEGIDVTVSPEGYIFLPAAGRLTVAGQTLQQARDTITQTYQKLYDQPEVTLVVSMQRVVDFYVMGDVRKPGRHTLMGMATVFQALYAAGGPSESGSYRRIRLQRMGEKPRTIDLYDALMRGEQTGDALLQSGDTIFVPPAQTEIGVAGQVRRAARYELTAPTTLAEALDMAAGLAPDAYAPTIEVWRTGDHRGWQLVNLDAAKDNSGFLLQDGDLIVAKALLARAEQSVAIEFAVRRPGTYALAEGMTVSKLVRLAEGPTEAASFQTGLIWRWDEAGGYQVVHFSLKDALTGDPQFDPKLQARDIVRVLPRRTEKVKVDGAVLRASLYDFGEGMRVSDLVLLAGGLNPEAYAQRADLLRLQPNNQFTIIAVDLEKALSGDAAADIRLAAGDVLEVRNHDEVRPPRSVYIEGRVRSPGAFSRREGMRVSDLVYGAGGFEPGVSGIEFTHGRFRGKTEVVQLKVTPEGNGYRIEPDLVLDDDDRVSVQGYGDFIATAPVVRIGGMVAIQGAYSLRNDRTSQLDTVWSVIQRAGGLQPDADPRGIIVYRGLDQIFPNTEDLNRVMGMYNREAAATDRQLSSGTTEPSANSEQNTALAGAIAAGLAKGLGGSDSASGNDVYQIPPRFLAISQSLEAIPVDGEALLLSKGQKGDLSLESGDRIVVSRKRDTVAVVGAVVRPGAVPAHPNQTVAACLRAVGGPAEDAVLSRLMVLSPNGSAKPAGGKTIVLPGDVLIVPSQVLFRTAPKSSGWVESLKSLAAAAAAALLFR